MAGASLALIVALNLEVVSIVPPGLGTEPPDARTAASQGVRPGAIQQWIEDAPIDPAPAEETRTSPGTAVQPAEQLPITRFGREPDADVVEPTDATNAVDEPADMWQVLQVRLVPADRVSMSGGTAEPSGDAGTEKPEPVSDPPLDGPS